MSPEVAALVALGDTATADSDQAYDMALELSTLLESFNDLEPAPKWAFALSRYAGRLASMADKAHCETLRFAAAVRRAHGLPDFGPTGDPSMVSGGGDDDIQ